MRPGPLLCVGAAMGALVASVAFGAAGCNAGGLLEAQVGAADGGAGGGPPVVLGPSTTEIVNGGNVAQNAKYKLVFTLGQPTPNQGPAKGPDNRLNGGIVGAMNGP